MRKLFTHLTDAFDRDWSAHVARVRAARGPDVPESVIVREALVAAMEASEKRAAQTETLTRKGPLKLRGVGS